MKFSEKITELVLCILNVKYKIQVKGSFRPKEDKQLKIKKGFEVLYFIFMCNTAHISQILLE